MLNNDAGDQRILRFGLNTRSPVVDEEELPPGTSVGIHSKPNHGHEQFVVLTLLDSIP